MSEMFGKIDSKGVAQVGKTARCSSRDEQQKILSKPLEQSSRSPGAHSTALLGREAGSKAQRLPDQIGDAAALDRIAVRRQQRRIRRERRTLPVTGHADRPWHR